MLLNSDTGGLLQLPVEESLVGQEDEISEELETLRARVSELFPPRTVRIKGICGYYWAVKLGSPTHNYQPEHPMEVRVLVLLLCGLSLSPLSILSSSSYENSSCWLLLHFILSFYISGRIFGLWGMLVEFC